MRKRMLSMILILCLVLTVLPLQAHAETITGSCGENVTWSLDKSSWVLTISGTGAMKDYGYASTSSIYINPWVSYRKSIKRIVIEAGVTRIGMYSFPHFEALTRVDIPQSVEEIGQGAFYSCEKLSSITLPKNLKVIENSCFEYCKSLSSITIPDGVTEIPYDCFRFCVGLNRVYLPDNLQIIDGDAFYGCEKLWTIDIPDTVTTIGSNAFEGCSSLQTITIPDSVTEIGYRAFSNCTSLRTATISYRVSRLDNDLFAWCEDLHTVTLRGDAPDISDSAFSNVEATVYYSSHNETWTEDVMLDYGGTLTWKSKDFHGYRVVDEPATCEEDGYSALVCDCGLVEDEVITPAIGHDYQDNKCKNCYQRDPAALLEIAYSNMTLGNSLAMNFAFRQDFADDWTGCYAQIAKTYADGRESKVVTIPYDQWGSTIINGQWYYTLKFDGIAAKEMADAVYVNIYNAEGRLISKEFVDSVRSYAMRTLNNLATTPASLTMIVDLLNYGAAAQESFGYDTENLANNQLTPGQAALATPSADAADSRVAVENYLGSQLRLESQIMLRMAFSNVTEDMTAQVSFKDHYGRDVNYTIPGSDFEISGNVAVVTIDRIVLADARKDVTVQILDGDGNVVASATDSVASYIARMRLEAEDPLYEAILKFADSAFLYFHPGGFGEEDNVWE